MEQGNPKNTIILDAALPVFIRFGFRKTSMADIARTAGISRASLYLAFSSKEELFRAGSMRAHRHTLDKVAQALAEDCRVFDRIERAITTFQTELIAPFGRSDDADELFAANMALAADITLEARTKLLAMLAQTLSAASETGEIALDPMQTTPKHLAEVIVSAMEGINHARKGSPNLESDSRLFVRLLQMATAPRNR